VEKVEAHDLRVMTSEVIDSLTGRRHGRFIGRASGLAAQRMKEPAMSILKSFEKIADRFGSVLMLLTAAFVGGATALIGG
jgi:hypothetical protein